MDRGLLDAAEFNNVMSDRILGFADVSKVLMQQSYHQNAEQFEISFNKTKFDALPPKTKVIIENAVEAGVAGHVVEGGRPVLEGLHRVADQGRGLTRRPMRSSTAARNLRRSGEEEGRRESAVQGDRPIAACVRQARGAVGAGHRRQPKMAFDHYFGTKREGTDLT